MSREAEGKAHGKVILIGEHSVVYDKPAIALPFPVVNVVATVREGIENDNKTSICVTSRYFSGELQQAPVELSGFKASVEESLQLLHATNTNLSIQIDSSIPSGRGLGSSAAVAHAVVKGIFHYFDAPLPHDVQMHLVQIAETHAHGNPSGIDMEATSNEAPIWFQKGKKTTALFFKKPLHIVIADSGQFGDTRTAVESIRHMYRNQPTSARASIDLLGAYTHACKDALLEGNSTKVGELLNLAQTELVTLGVSDRKLDHLITIARANGALGAKLTGGGRGGCVLCLAEDEQHAQKLASALEKAGACQTWTSRISHP